MIGAVATVLFNRVGKVGEKLERETERILDIAVDAGIQAADPVTRHDTGELRRNKRIDESKGERVVLWLQDYAAYQDQGTVHQSGTNFTGAAAKAGTNVIVREFSSIDLG